MDSNEWILGSGAPLAQVIARTEEGSASQDLASADALTGAVSALDAFEADAPDQNWEDYSEGAVLVDYVDPEGAPQKAVISRKAITKPMARRTAQVQPKARSQSPRAMPMPFLGQVAGKIETWNFDKDSSLQIADLEQALTMAREYGPYVTTNFPGVFGLGVLTSTITLAGLDPGGLGFNSCLIPWFFIEVNFPNLQASPNAKLNIDIAGTYFNGAAYASNGIISYDPKVGVVLAVVPHVQIANTIRQASPFVDAVPTNLVVTAGIVPADCTMNVIIPGWNDPRVYEFLRRVRG
jgi:hypothetical protein